jgi:hypothetical protein
MRSDFRMMQDLNTVLQKGGAERMQDVKGFINDLQAQEKVSKF